MSTDATHNGHAARAGNPTSGKNTASTIAAPIEIKTVVASGSSPPLIVAFQPAWQAAASSTAAKTMNPWREEFQTVCGRSLPDLHAACEQARTINPGLDVETTRGATCPSRKSYPRVAMMQSEQNWCGNNGSRPLDSSP